MLSINKIRILLQNFLLRSFGFLTENLLILINLYITLQALTSSKRRKTKPLLLAEHVDPQFLY